MSTSAANPQRIPSRDSGSRPVREAGARVSLLGIDDVASWLGVEVSFIRRQIAERKIPFVKIGKYVRFDPKEIAEWIDAQRVRPESRTPNVRKYREL